MSARAWEPFEGTGELGGYGMCRRCGAALNPEGAVVVPRGTFRSGREEMRGRRAGRPAASDCDLVLVGTVLGE